MPAASASLPVSTMSMSTRLAACCARILAGSSGAGALVKLNLPTKSGFSLRYSSNAFCVRARFPATSTTVTVSGAFGFAVCARAAKGAAARAAAPPRTVRRAMVVFIVVVSPM